MSGVRRQFLKAVQKRVTKDVSVKQELLKKTLSKKILPKKILPKKTLSRKTLLRKILFRKAVLSVLTVTLLLSLFGGIFSTEAKAEGKKKGITIIEVIPHDICSVFPYMIDWKTKEGYDKNTALGYEGIRYMMSAFQIAGTRSKNGILSNVPGGLVSETLPDYNISFATGGGEWEAGCWRKYENSNIMNENGYFMYVGAGKGLYHLNLDTVVPEFETATEYGVHYRTRALERKGSENKKGRYEVSNPGYYWAKDYGEALAYPTNNIKQHTDYNYDLSFTEDPNGAYRVYGVTSASVVRAGEGEYDYQALLSENAVWDKGYEYRENGNYTPKSWRPYKVSDSRTDFSGKYLRISNSEKSDGIADLEPGYFKLFEESDKESMKPGTLLYQVEFTEAGKEGGSYCLPEREVARYLEGDSGDGKNYRDILFTYIGAGKGQYDVSFIYADSSYQGSRYKETLLTVSDQAGRYALTSETAKKTDLYEDVGEGQGDYVKAVTRLDCKDIDYTSWENNGVSSGTDHNGGWVFYSTSFDEKNGITQIEDLPEGTPQIGTKIHVYGQNRKKCYYQQNDFVNNEWFKLLVYLTAEDESGGLAWREYKEGNLTGQEIVRKYEEELEEFDNTYQIEVLQRTPGELTPEEVDRADLLYISNEPGLSGLEESDPLGSGESAWDKIGRITGRNKESGWQAYNGQSLAFTDDFSAQTLMAIYRNCLYHTQEDTPPAAIMFDIAKISDSYLSGEDAETSSNLGKLVYLVEFFEDPMYFAEFMPDYEEYNEEYSAIDGWDASVTVWDQDCSDYHAYNLGKNYMALDGAAHEAGEEIPSYSDGTWKESYFIKPQLSYEKSLGVWKIVDWVRGEHGASTQFPYGNCHAYKHETPEPGWTWWVPDDIVKIFKDGGSMQSVWSIMHSRTPRNNSEPVVIITNADGVSKKVMEDQVLTYYIYADSYEALEEAGGTYPAFDIEYKVNWTPEEVKEPTPLSSVIISRPGGITLESLQPAAYETSYRYHASGDFMEDGILKNTATQEYLITATDEKGNAGSAIVKIIVRETFMLN